MALTATPQADPVAAAVVRRRRAQQMLAFLRAFEHMTWDEQEAVYVCLERAAAPPTRHGLTLVKHP